MITGVKLIPLHHRSDERGTLFHMLRSDDPHFAGFGEIYFSTVNPGAVKAWRLQHTAVRHYAVPVGEIKVVLYDDRTGSPTSGVIQEVLLGEEHYQLLIIPPKIWSGFIGLGDRPALVADCTTIPHDPGHVSARSPFDPAIPYRWGGTP